MHNAERYPYTAIDSALGEAGLAPYVPLRLTYQGREVTVGGLLDTGATVNVLPYPVGMELGAVWEPRPPSCGSPGTWPSLTRVHSSSPPSQGRFRPCGWCWRGRRYQLCLCCWGKSTFLWNLTSVSTGRNWPLRSVPKAHRREQARPSSFFQGSPEAVVLSEVLREADTVENALDAYVTRRRPRTDWVQEQSRAALAAWLLPPAVSDATLRERGDQIMHARYEPLRPVP
jgi:hypothetical protein